MKVELIAVTEEAERIIEEAGRACYMSLDRMGPGTGPLFIKKIIKAGHLSVLEHASASFRVAGASRAFTHQLVRHRLCSFSQQSQRYVSEKDFGYVIPRSVKENAKAGEIYSETMERISAAYGRLTELGINREDARYILPNACMSVIVFTANFRQLRHMLVMRGDRNAQREIREVFIEALKLIREKAPSCFYDFEIDGDEGVIRFKEE